MKTFKGKLAMPTFLRQTVNLEKKSKLGLVSAEDQKELKNSHNLVYEYKAFDNNTEL